jgi:hypothetical protein
VATGRRHMCRDASECELVTGLLAACRGGGDRAEDARTPDLGAPPSAAHRLRAEQMPGVGCPSTRKKDAGARGT